MRNVTMQWFDCSNVGYLCERWRSDGETSSNLTISWENFSENQQVRWTRDYFARVERTFYEEAIGPRYQYINKVHLKQILI